MIRIDTHVAVWLYLGESEKLRPVAHLLEGNQLIISPMVLLELQFLYEVGKSNEGAENVISSLI